VAALIALVAVFNNQIVDFLRPAANWIHDLPAGWLIPVAVLFIISFPPLFGQEIVAVLCGLVWGLWVGFAIVSLGTFLGEIGNFYAFKYCCRARGEKLEKSNLTYALLAKVVRDGGFKIALIVRLSAIPGHFATAVFSACGMNIIVFSLAAFLSLPKQWITVYIGVVLEQSSDRSPDKTTKIISNVVLAATLLMTFGAMYYIYYKMGKAKAEVIYERRKARQVKLARADFTPYGERSMDTNSATVFNPSESDMDIPLKPTGDSVYQQWDSQGHAVGYASDPRLLAPQPKHAHHGIDSYARDEEEGAGGYRRPEASTDSVGWDMSGHAGSSPPALSNTTTGYAPPPGPPPAEEYSHSRETTDASYRTAVSDSHALR